MEEINKDLTVNNRNKSNKKNNRKSGKDNKKRRFSIKLFFSFIVFELIFTALTGLFVLYY